MLDDHEDGHERPRLRVGGVLDEPESALDPRTRESWPEAPLGVNPYFYYNITIMHYLEKPSVLGVIFASFTASLLGYDWYSQKS